MGGVSAGVVLALCLVALAAGWVDAVVGGGGLLQLPALLIGLPEAVPAAALAGTNKLSSIAGTATAAASYLRHVRLDWGVAVPTMLAAYAGSTAGARLLAYVPRAAFTPVVAVGVAVAGLYTWRRRDIGLETRLKADGAALRMRAVALGLGVGLWDGLLGPGTGVFLLLGFAAWLGYGFLEATALAKCVNLTTNAAALILLGVHGQVLWGLGGAMAACNVAGALAGARMAVRGGNGFIRRVLLLVVVGVEAKLVWDAVAPWLG
jgi:uncharacterized membrane protein YfcA